MRSHPAWVCGLKHITNIRNSLQSTVTPCVGVWIETIASNEDYSLENVTPCVGVWIETISQSSQSIPRGVTPCVGVWIETGSCFLSSSRVWSHTLRGCVD